MFSTLDNMGRVSLMMDLITQKQRAIGSNLANVDTPGYVRRDVTFADYLGTLNNPLETKLSERLGPSGVIEEHRGQTIEVDQELMALQENSILYTMATRRMSNIITEMKTVINVGK